MIGVVDASALVRLFIPDGPIPEMFEPFLSGVEQGNNVAIAPELLIAESANVLDRKRKRGEITDAESSSLLADMLSLPIRYYPHSPIVSDAFDIAREHELSIYDALYLSLAYDHGAVVFSADAAMISAAERMHLV